MSSSNDKKSKRLRRAQRARHLIRRLGELRLSVHRTLQHMRAQVFTADGSKVLVSASTLEAAAKTAGVVKGSNKAAAEIVGRLLAERAKELGISRVAFDRAGFKYHGRVKALADAAREAGLVF